jgi:hypothetical protein
MRVFKGTWVLAFVVVVLLLGGCGKKPGGKPISLDKLGGSLKLRLKVQKGDVFTFEETTREGNGLTRRTMKQYDVAYTAPKDIRILDTTKEVEFSGGGIPERIAKKQAKKLQGMRVEGVYDQYSATCSLTAVTTDEEVQQDVAMSQAVSPGLLGVVFPEKPVKVGDQWHVNLDFSVLQSFFGEGIQFDQGDGKSPLTFTLKGAEDDGTRTFAVVDYTMDNRFSIDNLLTMFLSAMNGGGGTRMDFAFKGTGTMRIDLETGMVVCDDSKLIVTGQIGDTKKRTQTTTTVRMTELTRGGRTVKLNF